eukprot:PITA_10056
MRLSFSYVITLVILCKWMAVSNGWQPATATWYGNLHGFGSDGGACGFGGIVKESPFNSKIAAGSSVLFKGGQGCGACYQVKCTESGVCSGKPVTVVITDECPGGGVCGGGKTHFDLSGASFDSIAAPGKDADLRKIGIVPISFQRVPCQYSGMNVAFHVDAGANNFYFAVLIQYQAGDGDLAAVELQQANSKSWQKMTHKWGVNWVLNSPNPLQAPFSIRLTSLSGKKTLTANNVIPKNWQPNATYKSNINYH